MEPPREEEKRTTKKHLAARHGVGSEDDGVHLVGNCHHGAAQDLVESFDPWHMLPASRRTYSPGKVRFHLEQIATDFFCHIDFL